MLYPLVKWIHILSAILAVGSNATYGFWIARASRQPETLPFTLKSIRAVDNRLANPAYGLLFLTGLLMVFLVKFPLTTPWILTSIIIYVIVALTGVIGFTPLLRRQIQILESQGPASPEYQALAQRGRILGIVLAILAVAIVFLMVVKPPLWS